MTQTTRRTLILAPIVIAIAFLMAVRFSAQTPPATSPQPATTAVKPADPIPFPPKLNQTLKLIQDRQDLLTEEYRKLEVQKLLVYQRAALELHLTAEQVDGMDPTPLQTGYAFVPKPSPTPTPPEKPK